MVILANVRSGPGTTAAAACQTHDPLRRRMTAPSPYYNMPPRSISQVQKGGPSNRGPKRSFKPGAAEVDFPPKFRFQSPMTLWKNCWNDLALAQRKVDAD